MAVDIALVQQAVLTAGGPTQSFTKTGFGTPEAALFWGTFADVNETADTHALMWAGITDGTTHRSVAAGSRDNVLGTTTTFGRGATDEVILIPRPANSTIINCEAAFSQWVTDGVEVNYGVLGANAYVANCMLFGGNIQADVVEFTTSTSIDGTTNVGTAFEPDLVIPLSIRHAINDTATAEAMLSMGFVLNRSPVEEIAMCFEEEHGSGTVGIPSKYLRTARGVSSITGAATAGPGIQFGTFTGSGFVVTTKDVASVALVCVALCLKFDDAGYADNKLWIGNLVTPSAPGVHTHDEPGIKPQAMLFAMGGVKTAELDAVQQKQAVGRFGIGAITAADTISASITIEDTAGANSDTGCYSSDNQIVLRNHTNTTSNYDAVLDAFVSDGADWNYSATQVGREWICLVFGESTQEVALTQAVTDSAAGEVGGAEAIDADGSVSTAVAGESIAAEGADLDQGVSIATGADLAARERAAFEQGVAIVVAGEVSGREAIDADGATTAAVAGEAAPAEGANLDGGTTAAVAGEPGGAERGPLEEGTTSAVAGEVSGAEALPVEEGVSSSVAASLTPRERIALGEGVLVAIAGEVSGVERVGLEAALAGTVAALEDPVEGSDLTESVATAVAASLTPAERVAIDGAVATAVAGQLVTQGGPVPVPLDQAVTTAIAAELLPVFRASLEAGVLTTVAGALSGAEAVDLDSALSTSTAGDISGAEHVDLDGGVSTSIAGEPSAAERVDAEGSVSTSVAGEPSLVERISVEGSVSTAVAGEPSGAEVIDAEGSVSTATAVEVSASERATMDQATVSSVAQQLIVEGIARRRIVFLN